MILHINYINISFLAFLRRDDVNVIVIDWNRLANRNYLTAKNGVPAVGRGLGQFINWLVSLGASYERMHLVGFSLGGHLVGAAGRETGSRVKRITGKFILYFKYPLGIKMDETILLFLIL